MCHAPAVIAVAFASSLVACSATRPVSLADCPVHTEECVELVTDQVMYELRPGMTVDEVDALFDVDGRVVEGGRYGSLEADELLETRISDWMTVYVPLRQGRVMEDSFAVLSRGLLPGDEAIPDTLEEAVPIGRSWYGFGAMSEARSATTRRKWTAGYRSSGT